MTYKCIYSFCEVVFKEKNKTIIKNLYDLSSQLKDTSDFTDSAYCF